jgi:hypothetical protein
LVLDSRLEIGGRFSINVSKEFVRRIDDEITVVSGFFTPYLRWVFLPHSQFRPYIEGTFGVGGSSTSLDEGLTRTEIAGNTVYPILGGGGGVHMFIIDSFSFDLGIHFSYLLPHTRSKVAPDMGRTTQTDYEMNGELVDIGIMAGFSAWFRARR